MKNPIELLAYLQAFKLGPVSAKKESQKTITNLRETIPATILGHYDRLMQRGKKGVAIVRNGVCSGCHMRLASGIIGELLRGEDVVLCDSCARYLHIPVDFRTVHLLKLRLS